MGRNEGTSVWSRLVMALKPRKPRERLTAEMHAEIDRLGLDRSWFQWITDQEGLELSQFALLQATKASQLFDKWHPRLIEFATAKRLQSPFPERDSLDVIDAAIHRILEPKIRDAERVPCRGRHTAAFFIAPLKVLPFVASEWPSAYMHPVFLTHGELSEWHTLYCGEESDHDSWWYVFQCWDAQVNPASELFDGMTPVAIEWGSCWGSLAGGRHAELWGIDSVGNASLVRDVGSVTY